MASITEYLKKLKDKGKSIVDIANDTGISHPTISRIKNGVTDPIKVHPSTCKALANTYGYELHYDNDNTPNFFKNLDDPRLTTDLDHDEVKQELDITIKLAEHGFDSTEKVEKLIKIYKEHYKVKNDLEDLRSKIDEMLKSFL